MGRTLAAVSGHDLRVMMMKLCLCRRTTIASGLCLTPRRYDMCDMYGMYGMYGTYGMYGMYGMYGTRIVCLLNYNAMGR